MDDVLISFDRLICLSKTPGLVLGFFPILRIKLLTRVTHFDILDSKGCLIMGKACVPSAVRL